jgi:hypothetical protein
MITKRMTGGAALVLALAGPANDVPRAAAAALAEGEAPRGRARAAYLAGKRASASKERRRHFTTGVAVSRALLSADPDDPEGLLWLAANLGAEALERGPLAALGVIPEMERLLLRMEARAPLYDHAAAARTLGVLYHKAPALISIGSKARARTFIELALRRAGDFPANQILAAEFFDDIGERDRARPLAQAYLRAPAEEAENPDAPAWRRIAERIAGQSERR